MPTTRELSSFPKNVRYQRVALADAKNAIGPWKDAIGLLPPELEPGTAVSYLLYGPEDAGSTEPTKADYEAMEAWCNECEPTFAAIDDGLDRAALQFPESYGFGASWDSVCELIIALRKISHARTIKASLLQRRGDLARAAVELIKVFRMGELICNGDGLMVCYLTGSGIRNRALNTLLEIIRSNQLNSATANATVKLLQAESVRALQQPEGLTQACRVEFFQFGLTWIEAVPTSDDINQLVDHLIKHFYDSNLLSDLDETSEKVSQLIRGQRQSFRKRQLQQLLAGHPRPYDRDETIRILVRATSRYIAWLEFVMRNPNSRWRHRLRDFVSKWQLGRLPRVAGWPESLSPGFPFELIGVDEVAEAARKNYLCQSEGYPPNWRPLTDAEVVACSKGLRSVFNPVGKLLAVQQAVFDASHLCFEHYRTLQTINCETARQL